MKIQLRKAEGKYWISAFDANDQCHIKKEIDENEFVIAFVYYSESGLMLAVDDHGQSDELYEVIVA